MLSAEVAAIRRRDPDLDAGDITSFTFPLLVRAVGVLAVGLVPLIVIRNGGDTDALLVPLAGSLALTIICNWWYIINGRIIAPISAEGNSTRAIGTPLTTLLNAPQ